jgi:hypothetical protein
VSCVAGCQCCVAIVSVCNQKAGGGQPGHNIGCCGAT